LEVTHVRLSSVNGLISLIAMGGKTLRAVGAEAPVVEEPVDVGAAQAATTINRNIITTVRKENRLIILTMYTPLRSQAFQFQNQSEKQSGAQAQLMIVFQILYNFRPVILK